MSKPKAPPHAAPASPAADPLAPERVTLRRPGVTFTGVRVTTAREVTFSDGSKMRAVPGEWLVTQGQTVYAIIQPSDFPDGYEIVHEGSLTLLAHERTQLEEVVGVGACRSGAELLRATRRLAEICIGEIRIPFTPGQLDELQHRAQKRGRSVEQEIRAVVDRIESELFYGGRS